MTIYNISPVSPTSASSETYVAYGDLGVRPECAICDTISECTNCNGVANIPVVAGDPLFFQFRRPDNFNTDIENPVWGWRNGVDEYYVEAVIQTSSGTELVLDEQSIIIGKEVGWANGSYQNLILDSQKIQDWLYSIPSLDKCFRLIINQYSFVYDPILSVLGIFLNTGEILVPKNGDIAALLDGSLWIYDLGSWHPYGDFDGIIYTRKGSLYYEWNGSVWVQTTPESIRTLTSSCNTNWYEFAQCKLTVLLTGVHPLYDCQGFYYGGEKAYRDRYRIWASMELMAFRNERTFNENDVVTTNSQYESWSLRLMQPTSLGVATKINNTLNADTVYVDANEYINFTDVERNNEANFAWWSQVTCERLICEQDMSCGYELVTNPIVICETPSCPEVGEPVSLIGQDGVYSDTAACGSIKVIPHVVIKDGEGNQIATRDAGQEYICDTGCGVGCVTDTEESQTYTAECGGDCTIIPNKTYRVHWNGVLVETFTAPALLEELIINVTAQ